MNPIALIDLDGTVADFNGAMREGLASLVSPGEEPIDESSSWHDYPQHIQNRRDLIKRVPGFWRNLPIIPYGITVASMMRTLGFKLNVLSKGPFNTTSAWSEKVDWCRKNLPDADVTITEDKSGTYGRVLFDDWPEYCAGWLKWRPRGLVIMLEWPYNMDYEHPNVFKLKQYNEVGNLRTNMVDYYVQLDALKARLIEARDRSA